MNLSNITALEVALKAKELPKKVIGIYFLIAGCEVVYVGQTTNLASRLETHSANADNRKLFPKRPEYYHFIECPSDELDFWESYFILVFQPRANRKAGHVPLGVIEHAFQENGWTLPEQWKEIRTLAASGFALPKET